MLKTFVKGLVFGTGFAIALFAVSILLGVGMMEWKIGETIYSDSSYPEAAPELSNPRKAEIQPKRDTSADSRPNYSFFNTPRGRDRIPVGGGILGMTVLPTPPDATRPRTMQVWLTETGMWRIRTEETSVEVEKVGMPDLGDENPSTLVFRQLPTTAGGSSVTLSARSIDLLKRGEECDDDDHLNGEFRITTDGIVFMMPDALNR